MECNDLTTDQDTALHRWLEKFLVTFSWKLKATLFRQSHSLCRIPKLRKLRLVVAQAMQVSFANCSAATFIGF